MFLGDTSTLTAMLNGVNKVSEDTDKYINIPCVVDENKFDSQKFVELINDSISSWEKDIYEISTAENIYFEESKSERLAKVLGLLISFEEHKVLLKKILKIYGLTDFDDINKVYKLVDKFKSDDEILSSTKKKSFKHLTEIITILRAAKEAKAKLADIESDLL